MVIELYEDPIKHVYLVVSAYESSLFASQTEPTVRPVYCSSAFVPWCRVGISVRRPSEAVVIVASVK
jgi:hypothetical protein